MAISIAINCQILTFSGAINSQNGRQILYQPTAAAEPEAAADAYYGYGHHVGYSYAHGHHGHAHHGYYGYPYAHHGYYYYIFGEPPSTLADDFLLLLKKQQMLRIAEIPDPNWRQQKLSQLNSNPRRSWGDHTIEWNPPHPTTTPPKLLSHFQTAQEADFRCATLF
jgi:hypothetical protein